jgi:hypothetical protein
MRLPIDSPVLADVRGLLSSDFDSPLPSEDTLEGGWNDPRVRQYFADASNGPEIGRLLQETAVRAFAGVQGRIALSTGIPTAVIGSFAESVSRLALQQGERDWAAFAQGTAMAVIDIAIDAMGQIPIIGWVAQLSQALINAVLAAVNKPVPEPLLLTYKRSADEDIAQLALRAIDDGEWTRLFLPAWDGDWEASDAEDGYAVHPKNPTDGFGCVPPSAFGLVSTQVRGELAAGVEAMLGVLGGNKAGITGAKWNTSKMAPFIENTYDLTPATARIANAAWSAASTNRTASAFNIETKAVSSKWSDFVESALAYREYQRKRPREPLGIAVQMQVTRPPVVVQAPPGFLPHVNPQRMRIDLLAGAWASFLRQRQTELCKTPLVAYVGMHDQEAFDDFALRQEANEGRKLLLTTLDANDLSPDDILDQDFRAALADYKGPRAGRMPGRPAGTPSLVKVAPVHIVGIPPAGSGGGLAVAAAAAGLVYIVSRRLRTRRKA